MSLTQLPNLDFAADIVKGLIFQISSRFEVLLTSRRRLNLIAVPLIKHERTRALSRASMSARVLRSSQVVQAANPRALASPVPRMPLNPTMSIILLSSEAAPLLRVCCKCYSKRAWFTMMASYGDLNIDVRRSRISDHSRVVMVIQSRERRIRLCVVCVGMGVFVRV